MSISRAIESIRAEYARAIGPVADPALDETLAQFGVPADAADEFPLDKLPQLIEKLSWEIQSERRRAAFQQEALRQLQDLR